MKRIRFNEKSNIGFFDGARKKEEEEEEEEEEEVEEEGKKNYIPILSKDFRWIFQEFNTVILHRPELYTTTTPYPILYLLFTYQRDRFENFARHSRSW